MCRWKWTKGKKGGHQQLLLTMNKIKKRRSPSTIGENEQIKEKIVVVEDELRGSVRRLRIKEQCKKVKN